MFKYRFLCSNEEEIRAKIQAVTESEKYSGRTFFGQKLYKSGIHFTDCESQIKGFYLHSSESEVGRGSPVRLIFCGEFKKRR